MTFKPLGTVAGGLVAKIASAMKEDAERLAAHYSYSVDALWHQYQRRCFGSFSTTIDGSEYERDRYFRAWKLAFERQAENAKKMEALAS